MKSICHSLIAALLLSSFATATAQIAPGKNKEDTLAQQKVIELLESRHGLSYYDENINTPGDFIYSSHIETRINKRPGTDFNDYWVQVTDHTRYDSPGKCMNFYVDPKTWEVFYFDTKTNLVWAWDTWTRQNRYRRS